MELKFLEIIKISIIMTLLIEIFIFNILDGFKEKVVGGLLIFIFLLIVFISIGFIA
jgi:hypothetical protein